MSAPDSPHGAPEVDRLGRWLWVAVLAGLVYLVKHGYAYGVGDHDEMLPQLFRMLDPELYPRDWFVVGQGDRFTVRTPFLGLLWLTSQVMPPAAAVAVVYIVGIVAVGAGVYGLARSLGVSTEAAGLATVVAVGVVPTWALSGSALAFRALVPEMLAWAVALPAIRLAVRDRMVTAGLLLGAAAYLQLLVGALTAVVLGLALVFGALPGTGRERWARALKLGGSALAVALPLVALVLHDRATGPAIPPGSMSSYALIAELRLPHHLLPSQFGADRWLRFSIIAVAGIAALTWLRRRDRPLVFVERFALAVVVACGLAWPLAEAADSVFVAQLQVFKTTVPLVTLFVVAVAAALWDALPAHLGHAVGVPFRRPVVGWGATFGTVALVAALVAAGPLRHRIGPLSRHAAEVDLEAWARTETPRDALFVVPPSNTSFRSGSRRSVAITFKPSAFQEGSMHEWYRRLLTVAPSVDRGARGFDFARALDSAYAQNAPDDWRRLADEWGVDYAVVNLTSSGLPDGEPAFVSGKWAVYRLRTTGPVPPRPPR